MDWYKKDLQAYRRHTRDLTPAQNGIYDRLLTEYYSSENPLPDDPKYLAIVCRCVTKRDKDALNVVMGKFFPLNGDGFRHNIRADEEIADYKAKCDANRIAARSRYAERPQSVPPASRLPIEREIDRKKDQPVDKFCKHDNGNGTTCGKPGSHKVDRSERWYCSGHPDG